ncbi:LysR family transcriptional regulator [Ferrimonas senticii]|uniref:LysR family transcriptional regulator n=1 Tax=Ferrimonas senticii TaxID=394566 RepID=UPI000415F5EE|nr:LysR family transcriptional regulator [Ferrimonas senticii]
MKTRSDDLVLVLAVADSGGFSNAAAQLDLQVAKVSRAVSRVEQQLQTSLFNRTTRQVTLTEEGRRFIEAVRVGLNQLEQAELSLLAPDSPPAGRLRVDAATPFVLHQLVPLVAEFSQCYPDIELQLSSNEGFVDLLEQRTDVAIRIGALADSSLTARALGRSPLLLVAAPAYLQRYGQPQTAADLSGHQLLGFSGNRVLNRWPLRSNGQSGLEITPTLSCTNGEAVRQLALAGNGIACLSGFMVQADIAAGRLQSLLQADYCPDGDREQVNAVYYKASAVSRRVHAFLDFIQPRLTL